MQHRIADADRNRVAAFQSGGAGVLRDIVEARRQPAVADIRLSCAGHANRERRWLVARLSENGRYNIQAITPG